MHRTQLSAFVAQFANLEYDFLEGGARRKKLRNDLDHKINKSNPRKAQPFKEKLFVKQNKADEVFFEMGRHFWVSENFSDNTANCLDFVFNFVCSLFDGKCPNKKIWPNCFVGLDADKSAEYTVLERHPASVFKRELIPMPVADDGQCELKDHQVKFRKKTHQMHKSCKYCMFHLTGHLLKDISANDALIRTIYVQTIPEKVWAEDKNIRFDVVLKAYSCKIWWAEQKQQRMVAIALNLLILDETVIKEIVEINNYMKIIL